MVDDVGKLLRDCLESFYIAEMRLSKKGASVTAYYANGYTEKLAQINRFLDFVGLEHACATPFQEMHIEFTKTWARRAYTICKELRDKEFAAKENTSDAAGPERSRTGAVVSSLMTQSLNRIANYDLGDLMHK